MVVVAIIAILAVAGIFGYSTYIKRARDSRRRTDVQAIAQDLVNFRMDFGRYPRISEFFAESDGGVSGFHAFAGGQYVKDNALIAPDNNTCYMYCCRDGESWRCLIPTLTGGRCPGPDPDTASTNKCSQFAVCARLENRGGNFPPLINPAITINDNGADGLPKEAFNSLVEDANKDFYCATSP